MVQYYWCTNCIGYLFFGYLSHCDLSQPMYLCSPSIGQASRRRLQQQWLDWRQWGKPQRFGPKQPVIFLGGTPPLALVMVLGVVQQPNPSKTQSVFACSPGGSVPSDRDLSKLVQARAWITTATWDLPPLGPELGCRPFGI